MSEEKNQQGGHIFMAGLFLAIGIGFAGYFVSNTLYKAQISSNTATVKGLAERDVRADVAVWNILFENDGAQMQDVYAKAQDDQNKVVAFLQANGFAPNEMGKGALTVNKREQRDNETGELKQVSYQIMGAVALRSANVDKVALTQQRIGELLGQGVLVTNSSPTYLFTKLNEVKPEMLGEATRNARIAAEQFAKDANAKVGKIQSANQGAFDLSARDARSDYEDHAYAIDKKVRVVTTITFYLED